MKAIELAFISPIVIVDFLYSHLFENIKDITIACDHGVKINWDKRLAKRKEWSLFCIICFVVEDF